MRRGALVGLAFAIVLVAPGTAGAACGTGAPGPGDWPSYNAGRSGSRANATERTLSRRTAGGLRVLWRVSTPFANVYGTPAVANGCVYAADTAGNLWALDAATGAEVWLSHVGTVSPFPWFITSSPLVTRDEVIVGDQSGTIHALDRATGAERWSAHPNSYGYPAIWGSPTLATVRTAAGARTLVLVPVASNEETYVTSSDSPCCTSRGSVAALDPETGKVVWQTYTITDADAAAGAAGASVWTTPVYSPRTNLVYVTTGNNFANHEHAKTTATEDAFLALDAATGRLRWKNRRTLDDTYVTAYHQFGGEHVDADFGDSPEVVRLPPDRHGRRRLVVAAGQKSGIEHVIDARTGRLVSWHAFLPGGGFGGFFADAAQAHGVLYANGNDWVDYGGGELGAAATPITGTPPPKAGSIFAIRLDARGRQHQRWKFSTPASPMMGGIAFADGVVYALGARTGMLYALDARNGAQLVHVHVGIGVNGPSVSGGRVFVGVGDDSGAAGSDPTSGAIVALGLP